MQFGTLFFGLVLPALALASPMPENAGSSPLVRRCAGSKAGCNTMPSGTCDQAAGKLQHDKIYRTGGSRGDSGESQISSGFGGGCGIFLEDAYDGADCSASGAMMKVMREEMVEGGCGKCGEMKLNKYCIVKSDYVGLHDD